MLGLIHHDAGARMTVIDRDLGWKAIKREISMAHRREVAVGIMAGSKNSEGADIAEYAGYNEFGTAHIPARPFTAMSFDENLPQISRDFDVQGGMILTGKATARSALIVIGQRHADRVKDTITKRDILPKLAQSTIDAKGSTKTLVDSSAMTNAVQISVRMRK